MLAGTTAMAIEEHWLDFRKGTTASDSADVKGLAVTLLA